MNISDINWLTLAVAEERLPYARYAQLSDNGSLTRRVQKACQGQFKVSLIGQEIVRPGVEERTLLNLSEEAWALARQVFLCCDGRPLIFARTVIGRVKKNQQLVTRIADLGEDSLGSILFMDPLANRLHMHLACLPLDHPFFGQIALTELCSDSEVWVRRSLYDYEGCGLVVYEAFIDF